MRIGVLYTCYNCESYVDASLAPWLKLREEMDITIAANSGMFRDYLHLGIEEKNEGTVKKLIEKKLDFLAVSSGKNLMDEDQSRDVCLDFLNGGRWRRGNSCDLLFVVDGDEIFTEDQIRNILKFVTENPDHQGYKIIFKNHTFRKGTFLNYEHDRVFWMKKHGGINRFYFDNLFEYVDHANGDKEVRYTDSLTIPKTVAFVDHYSWLAEDPRTLDKIHYQNLRYHGINHEVPPHVRCSYRWDKESNTLKFNEEFYAYRRWQIPLVQEAGEKYCLEFDMVFYRPENRIYIYNKTLSGKYTVEVSDEVSSLFTCDLEMNPGGNYWVMPTGYSLDEAGVEWIVATVKSENRIIHEEKFYLKV